MGRQKTSDQQFIEGLLGRLSRDGFAALVPGEWSGSVYLADHVVDVEVRVRRRLDSAKAVDYLEQALAHLASLHYPVTICDDFKKHKKRWFQSGRCSNTVTSAIVWKNLYDEKTLFRFVCSAHAEHHKTDASVLAVLPLPKYRLLPIQKEKARQAEERYRQRDRWENFLRFLGAIGKLEDAHPPGCICPEHLQARKRA